MQCCPASASSGSQSSSTAAWARVVIATSSAAVRTRTATRCSRSRAAQHSPLRRRRSHSVTNQHNQRWQQRLDSHRLTRWAPTLLCLPARGLSLSHSLWLHHKDKVLLHLALLLQVPTTMGQIHMADTCPPHRVCHCLQQSPSPSPSPRPRPSRHPFQATHRGHRGRSGTCHRRSIRR